MLPIVAGGVRPGWEIEHPMAVVITGGLLTSTLVNLLLLPALFPGYGPARGPRGTTTHETDRSTGMRVAPPEDQSSSVRATA
jgi:hypothetical protein